ncbi:MAG: hypothetical protein IJY11_02925 [Clostridia bacterium]|nr:hypothetical protein [Clostridia bacterium]
MRLRAKKKRAPFRLSVHPLFLLTGVWYCFIGKLPLFFISALVALQHECAHAFAAAKLGYRLNRVVLMPYGAVIDGDLSGLSLKDEVFVALCGPLVNLATAAFFVALWWLCPSWYPFTDTACYASAFIGLLNLLPSYPLDGGRVLMSVLQRLFLKKHPPRDAEKKARACCLTLSIVVSIALLSLFVLLCVSGEYNFTLLAFALFLGVGAVGHLKDKNKTRYARIDYSFKDAFRRGVCIRHVAVDEHCTVKQALRFLDERTFVAFEIYDDKERFLGTLSQNTFAEKFATSSLRQPLREML